MTLEVAKYVKTAQVQMACVGINAGDFVEVKYSHTSASGCKWFEIKKGEHSSIYPENLLKRFCL